MAGNRLFLCFLDRTPTLDLVIFLFNYKWFARVLCKMQCEIKTCAEMDVCRSRFLVLPFLLFF